ncbi:STAS domain-containing protein [Alkalihalobacillus sp. CinArs1]|uniref:STAS domain-containing protein n=1 Tax=Alkalihalobacillus sp. CinArs1 TaxID=2995314 RepID=UPI0022DE7568|nr:STAS domain-containing protein [Alkalihalobacillus sp. CinArs1]
MGNDLSTNHHYLDVNGSKFEWDTDEGSFTYEGDGALIFWINTAFKVFLDSIEEIAGEDEAALVLETAGYRTGEIVSDFYHESIGNIELIVSSLPNTYKTAGWGITTILDVDQARNKAIVRVKNSWEYKVNREQGKHEEGTFIPGHWAGVFSGLFKEKVWYNVRKSQIKGDSYSEYEFAPSSITPKEHIRDLIQEKKRLELVDLEKKVSERTNELQQMIKEISAPIIPVLDHILVIPLIGKYDETRIDELMTKTLKQLPDYKANTLILDLTGINDVDNVTIDLLHSMVKASELLGVTCLLVGISPKLSIQVVQSRAELEGLTCFSTLRHGIHFALAREGLTLESQR